MKTYLISAILVFLINSPPANAACGLSVTASNVSLSWDLNFTHVSVQMTINKANDESCNFGIGISKGGAASYTSRRAADGTKLLRYQVYSDNALSKVVKDVPDITTADDVIMGGFQAGTNLTQTVVYYLDIPYSLATTPTLVPSGSYTDSYNINLYEGSDPLAFVTPVDTESVTLSVSVDKLIQLSLVDTGSSFQVAATNRNVNFGTLAQGQATAFDLFLRTNSGFSVSFSSANDGRLKHTTPGRNSFVPFSLYVNGVVLNLSGSSTSPVVGLSGSGQTSLQGLGYPVRLVIGNVSGASTIAGPHGDVITMTATTTE